jgi:hypothetical protein
MQCPYGHEVGDPPHHARCPMGFPGCHCSEAMWNYAYGDLTEQEVPVLRFWRRHAPEDWSDGHRWEPSGGS